MKNISRYRILSTKGRFWLPATILEHATLYLKPTRIPADFFAFINISKEQSSDSHKSTNLCNSVIMPALLKWVHSAKPIRLSVCPMNKAQKRCVWELWLLLSSNRIGNPCWKLNPPPKQWPKCPWSQKCTSLYLEYSYHIIISYHNICYDTNHPELNCALHK